jgi:hypothetical protein
MSPVAIAGYVEQLLDDGLARPKVLLLLQGRRK